MTSTTTQPHSISTAVAILSQLHAAGVTDVVLCPGSRNAPLALAAAATPGLTVHTRLDERAASFTALGLARVQRRHTAVIMTSGTAVANCLPAMIEAHHSGTPLIVLSADRPRRLHGVGASQTIEQAHLFDGYATSHTIDTATTPAQAADDTARLLEEHAHIHLNVEFDEPLVGHELPTAPAAQAPDAQAPAGHAPDAHAPAGHAPAGRARNFLVERPAIAIDLNKNTLVIAGDGAWEVPGLEDVPTIAEPGAPAPYRPIHPLAAGFFAKERISHDGYVVDTRPEQIIVVGRPTLHRAVLALTADPHIELIVLSRAAQPYRPHGKNPTLGGAVTTTGAPSKQWLKICEAASTLGADSVRDILDTDTFGFTGLHAAAAVADTLAVGDTLLVGASNPVRDISLVGLPFDGVDTYTPRGAAGIDGTVSQAMGIALATQQAHPDTLRAPRTIALMGDVTFLHDASGLLTPTGAPRPNNLTIVVANDNGGAIFETLEVGAAGLRDSFETCFATPHSADIEALAHAYGARHQRASSVRELLDALIDTIDEGDGITIIEATVSRDNRRSMHQALANKVI